MNQKTQERYNRARMAVVVSAVFALVCAGVWMARGHSWSILILFSLILLEPLFSWMCLRHVLIRNLSYNPKADDTREMLGHFGLLIFAWVTGMILAALFLFMFLAQAGVVIQ